MIGTADFVRFRFSGFSSLPPAGDLLLAVKQPEVSPVL